MNKIDGSAEKHYSALKRALGSMKKQAKELKPDEIKIFEVVTSCAGGGDLTVCAKWRSDAMFVYSLSQVCNKEFPFFNCPTCNVNDIKRS